MGEALEVEIKNDNRVVSGWLLHYHERKRDYEQRREDILNSSPQPQHVPGRAFTSDTTGRKGEKLADLEAGRWLALVEEVSRRLPWKMQILLRLKQRYRIGVRGRPVRWLIALELSEEVSRRLKKDYSVGPDTIDDWWGRVVEYAARVAGKKGLL